MQRCRTTGIALGAFAMLLAALSGWLAPAAGQPLSAHLYLVDPRGEWMMRWPASADPTAIKKDLLRLMKANNSWDEAGR